LDKSIVNGTLELDEEKLMKLSKPQKLNENEEDASISIDLESMEFISLEPKRMVYY